jgi:hypothetical protein
VRTLPPTKTHLPAAFASKHVAIWSAGGVFRVKLFVVGASDLLWGETSQFRGIKGELARYQPRRQDNFAFGGQHRGLS